LNEYCCRSSSINSPVTYHLYTHHHHHQSTRQSLITYIHIIINQLASHLSPIYTASSSSINSPVTYHIYTQHHHHQSTRHSLITYIHSIINQLPSHLSPIYTASLLIHSWPIYTSIQDQLVVISEVPRLPTVVLLVHGSPRKIVRLWILSVVVTECVRGRSRTARSGNSGCEMFNMDHVLRNLDWPVSTSSFLSTGG
jgi:hypothetical protein